MNVVFFGSEPAPFVFVSGRIESTLVELKYNLYYIKCFMGHVCPVYLPSRGSVRVGSHSVHRHHIDTVAYWLKFLEVNL